ncbi:glyoxalase [Rhodococcoides trifolii]|uniref:Glyoxalase n=1 Tax=Rhodococcoides trifolii TaxID=908250 RepID=A0A917CTZ2_9NOCA|nr:VOC family protein [Rhodococcus trifolii]GGF95981.1 glyoxalase [Rhodococcus trifolii]
MTPRFAVIELVVVDMAASLNFYRALGLELSTDLDAAPHAELELPGGLKMAWDTVETIASFDPSFVKPEGSGMSLAFECESPAEVDATYEAMTAAGYDGHLKPFDAFWGQRYAAITDPDGYGVDLFAAS